MNGFTKAVAAGLLCGLALTSVPVTAGPRPAAVVDSGERVNINTASEGDLARLPGIGPAKAQAIVQHRNREPFARPDDLRKVKGIGDKLFEQIKDQVTVGDGGTKVGRGS